MRTYLDCIPCFLRLILEQGRLLTDDERIHRELMNEAARLIPGFSFGATPPRIVRKFQGVIRERFPACDPYKKIKDQSNRRAMELYPQLKVKVVQADDPLLTALELAIAGNVIDYAAKNNLNIEKEIQTILTGSFGDEEKKVFEYDVFRKELAEAKTILYLADNAGEILFDRVLIEELCKTHVVTVAVRDKPILNDALMADAVFCGLDKVAQIVSSGVDAPGTVLEYCSDDFLKIFKEADMVISKGQGNYEALSEAQREIYFLFKVKCPVIARHSGAGLGDLVLKRI
jgi:damage-control phosphatase, subfamily I